MISVMTRIPVPYSAVSFYRSTGPFQHLRSKMDIQFIEPTNYNWLTIGMHDIALLERPHTDKDLNLIRMCKDFNRPVVVDYDDYLFAVPLWNPAHNQYEAAKPIMREILSLADVVTVSTKELAIKLNQFRSGVSPCMVIPNAFPSHIIDFHVTQMPPREKVITWRGSNTHVMDLEIAHEAIESVLTHHQDWTVVLMGDPPYQTIKKFGRHVKTIPTLDPIPYINTLFNLKPSIHMIPLHDDEFNRCKSNIAYIEATYAGAVTIAPLWDGWDDSYPYGGDVSFKDALLELMSDVPNDAFFSRAAIKENLTLDTVNHMRKELFQSLV